MKTGWVIVALVLTTSSARAADEDAYVRRAQELMDEAEYARAAKVLRLGLAREEVTTQQMVDHFALQAVCYISLSKNAQARSSYAKILTMQPSFRLPPDTSPKVASVFEATRDKMKASGLLRATFKPLHTPISTRRPGQPVTATLGFEEGADDVRQVRMFLRRLGTADFTSLDAASDGSGFVAEVPAYLLATETEVYGMEYFLQAYDENQIPVGSVGSAELPLSFLVVPDAEIETGEELGGGDATLYLVPVIVGGVVLAVAVVAAAGVAGGLYLFRPRIGRASVTVRQE